MTDAENVLPAVPERHPEVRHHEPNQGLALISLAIAQAEEQAREVALTGDYETLAYGYNELQGVKKDLTTLLKTVEQLIIETAPKRTGKNGKEYNETFHVEGAGTFETTRRAATRKWDSEALLEDLVRGALIDRDTGQVPTEEERAAVDKVVAVLAAAVPFTASLGWRITALEELGVQPDEYYEESRPAGHSLKHTGGKK